MGMLKKIINKNNRFDGRSKKMPETNLSLLITIRFVCGHFRAGMVCLPQKGKLG